jgi:hypothetical protein
MKFILLYLHLFKSKTFMKKLVIILMIAAGFHANAQRIIKATNYIVVMNADSISLREAFNTLKFATPISRFYCEFHVYKNGKRYMRSYLSLLPRNQVYLIEKGKRWQRVMI